MKLKLYFIAFFIVCFTVAAHANSFSTAWTGFGLTGKYNYDISQSYGTTYYRGIAYGVGVGTDVFVQNYNLYYNKDQGKQYGASVRHSSSYSFASPMTIVHLTHTGKTQVYVNAGMGYKIDGYDSVRKWNKVSYRSEGIYDSTIDASQNISSTVYRIGMGATTYFSISRFLRISITEDLGFLTTPLSKTREAESPTFNNAAAKFFKPTYFTIRVGITYRTPTKEDIMDKFLKNIR
ncbi:MAG: hypothetical protein EBX41_02945 [Chitinophagia bacterium]|nr:hypothetical protein [Chitinophagia bacterium]